MHRLPRLFVASESNSIVGQIHSQFTAWGYQVTATSSLEKLTQRLASDGPDVILLDSQLHSSTQSGLEALQELKQAGHVIPVIAMVDATDTKLKAIFAASGAFAVVENPPSLSQVRSVIEESLAQPKAAPSARRQSPKRSVPAAKGESQFGIIGDSQAIRDVLELVHDVAESEATVLILGESGTGKELLARAIHECSSRRAKPFVPVNVAALPATLSESILFGHEKGAYTGADAASGGWCETAHGGTLMLDEIGEMDIQLQAKLLRFLQDGTFMRVGSNHPRTANVRVVAATNREPELMVREGLMREDLYYRLNVFPIRMPALRERPTDIPLLAETFLARSVETHRRSVVGFRKEAMDCLVAYHWPGNVRQLENLVTRLVLLARESYIGLHNLPLEIKGDGSSRQETPEVGLSPIEVMEKRAIISSLHETSGNAVAAARLLGLGQATIYRKIKRYGIDLKTFKFKPSSKSIVSTI